MSNVTGCPNCGAALTGRYCSECGQRRIEPDEYSLGHFLHHALHDLTHLDAKVFGSIVPIAVQPGRATADYIAGRRSRYLRPLQTFIILNLIFFFAAGKLHIFGFDTAMYLKYANQAKVLFTMRADELVNEKAREEHQTVAELAPHLDEKIDHQKRSILLLLVPLFAVFVMLVEWRAHRTYIEHLIFSIHFFCFWLMLMLLLVLPAKLLHLRGENGVLLMMIVATTLYLAIALRRVYGGRLWMQAGGALALSFVLLITMRLFRDLVFFTALMTL